MGEVGPCLGEIGDAVVVRPAGVAESAQLRKHVPHPVAHLLAGAQLGEGVGVGGLGSALGTAVLGFDEAFEVVVGRTHRGSAPVALVRMPSRMAAWAATSLSL